MGHFHDKNLARLRVEMEALRSQASEVHGDELRLKQLARRHALKKQQEQMLGNQALVVDKLLSQIEAKKMLVATAEDNKLIERVSGAIGLDAKEAQEITVELGAAMRRIDQSLNEMQRQFDLVSGEQEGLSDNEEAFIQEVLAEQEATATKRSDVREEIRKERERA